METIIDVEVSICIPTFNRCGHLDFLLGKLHEQTFDLDLNYEILISNNASEDDTKKVVLSWQQKLPIRYYEQKTNIGGLRNLSFLFEKAVGEFSFYLADDDYVDLQSLSNCLCEAQSNPDVGIIYTPWKIGKINDITAKQFYSHPADIMIAKGNFSDLLNIILRYHIFPEIFLFRTNKYLELIPMTRENIVFDYFSIISEWISTTNILFSNKAFYTSVVEHPAGPRIQNGNEQAKFMWDSYRGGLELLLGKSLKLISPEAAPNFRENINSFIAVRLSVAIRLRILDKSDSIETYLLACRLRGMGQQNLLPIPFEQICVLAAFEYVLRRTMDKEIDTTILLGDFSPGVVAFLQSQLDIKNIIILKKMPKNQKNAIIFFRLGELDETIKNNSFDKHGNYYFSEYFLMNVKFT